mmetsp:Transcript_17433/g.47192  ORF Transcript_17433/g.47192 Transcript_17433/m.47192 type:complete len:261 (+) Transcript_17433:227-1009(+)
MAPSPCPPCPAIPPLAVTPRARALPPASSATTRRRRLLPAVPRGEDGGLVVVVVIVGRPVVRGGHGWKLRTRLRVNLLDLQCERVDEDVEARRARLQLAQLAPAAAAALVRLAHPPQPLADRIGKRRLVAFPARSHPGHRPHLGRRGVRQQPLQPRRFSRSHTRVLRAEESEEVDGGARAQPVQVWWRLKLLGSGGEGERAAKGVSVGDGEGTTRLQLLQLRPCEGAAERVADRDPRAHRHHVPQVCRVRRGVGERRGAA